MADESDGPRADAIQQFLKALDDDYKAALEDPARDIIARVRDGTITRAKAEEWALEQGRPPFASKPDPATFDPQGKRSWTLAQMAAWVVWRTDDAVRAVSEDYLRDCVEWVEARRPRVRFVSPVELEFTSPTDRVGYELGSPKPSTAHDVLEDARHRGLLGGPAPRLSPERAQREMLDALQAGDPLVARHGEGKAIDRYLWDGLLSFGPGDGPHDAVFYPSGRVVRFHRVRVERDAVLAVWPAEPGMAGPETAEAIPVTPDPPVKLPSAGRPSLAHFYEGEYRRHARSGEPQCGSGKEATRLRGWLVSQIAEGKVALGGHAVPSEDAIRKNVQKWRRQDKKRTKIGPK